MLSIDVLLGATFVVVYAADRFNIPPLDRSSTTAIRYYSAALFYCVFGLALYAILIQWPHLFTPLLQHGTQDTLSSWTRDLSSPLLVALLLTTLLPKFPALAGIDEWITKQLRYLAAIPYEVRRLSAELRKSDFHTPDELREKITAQLIDEGFDPADIVFDGSRTFQSLWIKSSVLMEHLAAWESHPKFTRFVGSFANELSELKREHRQLTPRVKKCFKLRRDLFSDAIKKVSDAVSEYQKDVQEQIEHVLEGIYHFISRGVLRCELTHSARCEQLTELGFTVQLVPLRLTVNHLLALFLGINMVMLFCFLVLRRGDLNPFNFTQVFVKCFMIASLYTVALCCAIYPKAKWKFAQSSHFRPVAFYLVAGILAVSAGVPINVGFRSLITQDLAAAWAEFTTVYPWMLMSFTTAFGIALLSDNKPTVTCPRSRLRWFEGGIQAVVGMITAWLVHEWLLTTAAPERVPDLAIMMLIASIISFAIGFFVPTWYREAPSQFPDGGKTCANQGPSRFGFSYLMNFDDQNR